IAVERLMILKDAPRYSFTIVRLSFPDVLTEANLDTRNWPVDKRKLTAFYNQVMFGMSFALEALQFISTLWQDVLMIGLGGGGINNFVTTLEPETKINLTTIELDPDMPRIASDWFGLRQSPTNKVVIEDGVKFVHSAAIRGEKYKAILLDACYNVISEPGLCPVKQFMKPEVIASIAKILERDGVLSINVLGRPGQAEQHSRKMISLYKGYFATAFYVTLAGQRVLFCSHRKDWSHLRYGNHFMKNVDKVKKTFGFDFVDLFRNGQLPF
ncbi:hypothetical protein GCK32_006629, partial [Trichostrongylus colubriformis]